MSQENTSSLIPDKNNSTLHEDHEDIFDHISLISS